jgi:hypothetical protein
MRKLVFMFLVLLAGAGSMPAQSGTDISLAVTPTTISLPQGGAAPITMTLGGSDKGRIDLSLAGLPEGVHAQIPAAHRGDVTMMLAAGPSAKLGTYTIQVIARSADNYQTNTFVLEVRPMPADPQWEYRVVSASSPEELTGSANAMGSQSWELVSVVLRDKERGALNVWVGFFKRLRRGN